MRLVDIGLLGILLVSLCNLFLLYRNKQVYHYRLKVLGKVSRAAVYDIGRREAWEWRFDAYTKVSYRKMLFQVWKPVRSFYDPVIWSYAN